MVTINGSDMDVVLPDHVCNTLGAGVEKLVGKLAGKPLWEYRYLHAKAIRDIACDMQGILRPTNEPYGVLQSIKIRSFNSKEFWPKFRALGHDSIIFESCSCNKGGFK